ncbi:hypothetical protein [Shewanella khirikhana]|uniref:Uncharacterized protein n=1 Tax=Shewanella khirikhana TaxID=1965282 RepID=A0ABM7D186_9GAMM|nr:hypothetical protein [Shewanella khirikhana]AZQ10139.1 hypothetical protein STH12_01003 [Shewanella khirikhana]
MSNNRLAAYQAWLTAVTDAGFNVIEFKAPCCGNSMKAICPETTDGVWDSLTFCPYCDEFYYKIVYHDRVETKPVYHPATEQKTA